MQGEDVVRRERVVDGLVGVNHTPPPHITTSHTTLTPTVGNPFGATATHLHHLIRSPGGLVFPRLPPYSPLDPDPYGSVPLRSRLGWAHRHLSVTEGGTTQG